MAHAAGQVLDALLELAGPVDDQGVRYGTGPLDGVLIIDGPPLADVDADAVALGLSIDASAAVGTTRRGYGDDRIESFDLSGLVQSFSGDVDMAGRRARAYELLDAVRALVATDPTVGGMCLRAALTQWTYRPVQGPQGSLAVVTFVIRVDARRFEGA